jgi:pimeloyl-ACP methyl ester carboxylesterase
MTKLLRTAALLLILVAVGPAGLAQASEVEWEPCASQDLRQAGAQCAEIPVPLDYSNPSAGSIGIAISRIPAQDRARRRGILLFNQGGPGIPGLDYPAEMLPTLRGVANHYDLIGFDPRLVGQSEGISCGPLPEGWWQWWTGFERPAFDELASFAADYARRCHEPAGNARLLPHASTRNVARDMNAIRVALGEEKMSYYGVSYGSYLGAVVTEMFGSRVDRIVLDSAVNPNAGPQQHDAAMGPALEDGLDQWAAWAAQRHARFRLGRTAAEVRGTVTRLIQRSQAGPIVIGDNQIDSRYLPFFVMMMLEAEDLNEVLAESVRNLVDAAAGISVMPTPELEDFMAALDANIPEAAAQAAAQVANYCAEMDWPRDPEVWWHTLLATSSTQPIFGPLTHAITPCAFWPTGAREPLTRVSNRVPTLIVQARGDVNTPWPGALAMHESLRASRLVSVPARLHGVYTQRVDGQPPIPCIEAVVNDYLRTGVLPAGNTSCPLAN